ncbi:DNA repair protein endonuclease SAE2/CtIP C-terminus-domain-containing protein [Aspergillus aurantiobrunneus]
MEALKQLHTSVAQSFENCFDTAYRNLNAELAASNARIRDAKERARAADDARRKTASEADALKHEISLLQEETRQDEIDSREREGFTESVLQLDEIYEPRRVLGAKDVSNVDSRNLKRISDRYTELYEQAGMLLQVSGELKRMAKRRKKKLEQLQSYFHRQEFTFMVDGKAVKFQRIETTGSPNPSVPPEFASLTANPLKEPNRALETNMSAKKPIIPTSKVIRDQGNSSPGDEWDSAREKRLQKDHPELTPTPSDTSTNELQPEQSGILKRKRVAPKQPLPNGDPSAESPGKDCLEHSMIIKKEALSSSPLRSYSPHPGPFGTQDLDDIGDIVVTPTKRVRFYKDRGPYATSENLPINVGSLSVQCMSHPNRTHREKQFSRVESRVLQPVNGNLRNPGGLDQSDKRRTKHLGSITRISSITEDGDENRNPSLARGEETKASPNNQNVRNSSNGRRLSDLLEGASPVSRMFQWVTTNAPARTQNRTSHSLVSGSSSTGRGGTDTTSTMVPTTSGSSRGNPKSKSADMLAHNSEPMGQMEAVPEEEPYRARPPQRLGLEHFRLNPNYNHGLDYAYDEVIRRKDERKCVSGCMRPGCCSEKFVAMARFGIPLDAPGETLNDHEILEEYLSEGNNLMDTLSPGDRENLLLEAKAKVFSDRFGKHRRQHHRPGTPPGFWRAEMPGTQELEKDREEAQRLRREKVKERYKEAMRPGGRWIFADE